VSCVQLRGASARTGQLRGGTRGAVGCALHALRRAPFSMQAMVLREAARPAACAAAGSCPLCCLRCCKLAQRGAAALLSWQLAAAARAGAWSLHAGPNRTTALMGCQLATQLKQSVLVYNPVRADPLLLPTCCIPPNSLAGSTDPQSKKKLSHNHPHSEI
jgi:hypothetical protein